MRVGGWRVAAVLAVLAVVAGCSKGTGVSAAGSATATARTAGTGINQVTLKKALLTSVNGVAAAKPASSGKYTSIALAAAGSQIAGSDATPKTCTVAAVQLFDPAVFAGAPAAAVTFTVEKNAVSEVLVASSAKSAAEALAAHVPTACARYSAQVGGKTVGYTVKEQQVTGVGTQAKALNIQEAGGATGNQWSLVYLGTGFVGTVMVVGPNASEKAVQELGQQAYAFAAKTLQ